MFQCGLSLGNDPEMFSPFHFSMHVLLNIAEVHLSSFMHSFFANYPRAWLASYIDCAGRVAMLATMGYIVPEYFRFPGVVASQHPRHWVCGPFSHCWMFGWDLTKQSPIWGGFCPRRTISNGRRCDLFTCSKYFMLLHQINSQLSSDSWVRVCQCTWVIQYSKISSNMFPATPWFGHTQTTHSNNMLYLSPEDEWKHWLYTVILTLSFQDLGF